VSRAAAGEGASQAAAGEHEAVSRAAAGAAGEGTSQAAAGEREAVSRAAVGEGASRTAASEREPVSRWGSRLGAQDTSGAADLALSIVAGDIRWALFVFRFFFLLYIVDALNWHVFGPRLRFDLNLICIGFDLFYWISLRSHRRGAFGDFYL